MHIGFLEIAGLSLTFALPLPGEQDWNNYDYETYVRDFGKKATAERAATFKANLDSINEHNANPSKTWYAAVNEYTDWSKDEFKAKRAHGTSKARPVTQNSEVEKARMAAWAAAEIPASLDWRDKSGVVTPVKNQGACGSCWAFSTTETMESAFALTTGKPAPVLSPQQITSCAPNPKHCGGTGGCQGATQEIGFNYTETAGLTTEEDYPYEAETGRCETSKIKALVKNSGFVKLPSNNYSALISAVAKVGPIAISVAAGSMSWQIYGGGVYSSKSCGYDQDHAVQLVGYGTEGSKDYWLVRNSWGASWGEKGYIKIQRFGEGKEPCGMDKTPGDGSACAGDDEPVKMCGLCGILSDSSYPTGLKQVSPSPSPGPSPGPAPGPSPPTPGCADDKDYCKYVKQQGSCSLLSDECLKSCGCCDANPPSYCKGVQDSIVV